MEHTLTTRPSAYRIDGAGCTDVLVHNAEGELEHYELRADSGPWLYDEKTGELV